jgi:hypothetical protein
MVPDNEDAYFTAECIETLHTYDPLDDEENVMGCDFSIEIEDDE